MDENRAGMGASRRTLRITVGREVMDLLTDPPRGHPFGGGGVCPNNQ